jgi:hypothetical protein
MNTRRVDGVATTIIENNHPTHELMGGGKNNFDKM